MNLLSRFLNDSQPSNLFLLQALILQTGNFPAALRGEEGEHAYSVAVLLALKQT